MNEEHEPPSIKITDRRHFAKNGEKRTDAEATSEGREAAGGSAAPPSGPRTPAGQSPAGTRAEPAGGKARPEAPPPPPSAPDASRATAPEHGHAPGDLSDIAAGLSSSFSLLIARLAQETEIYLGLVPYPGKETAEPDLEAARAMIDVLSMLQEKTRGNLEEQEAHLLENLLYTYRLEFVRLRSDGVAR